MFETTNWFDKCLHMFTSFSRTQFGSSAVHTKKATFSAARLTLRSAQGLPELLKGGILLADGLKSLRKQLGSATKT
jgi:hypothetical protein